MKSLDTKQFSDMTIGTLVSKEGAIDEKITKLKTDLQELETKLAEKQKALLDVKDNVSEYKKTFRIVSETSVDITAVKQLISHTEEEKTALVGDSIKLWNDAIRKYDDYIKPFLTEYEKKKSELFDIFIQIVSAEDDMNKIKNDITGLYAKDDRSYNQLRDFSHVDRSATMQFFKDDANKKVNGDGGKVLNLFYSGKA